MITAIEYLNDTCHVCCRRADFRITRTNDDLPKEYFKGGSRSEGYCKKHLSKEAKKMWQDELRA